VSDGSNRDSRCAGFGMDSGTVQRRRRRGHQRRNLSGAKGLTARNPGRGVSAARGHPTECAAMTHAEWIRKMLGDALEAVAAECLERRLEALERRMRNDG
jgi:hypothetical protein